MEHFELTASDKTPYVLIDGIKGLIEVRGCSIHENADRFFLPLLDQVEAYCKAPVDRTTVIFALTYFNSSSAKYLLDLLKVLEELHATGQSRVELEWRYDEGDLDMQEAGEDFKGLLEFPVKLKEQD